MMYEKECSTSSVLLPVFLLAVALAGLLAAQTWMLVTDHSLLADAYEKQTEALNQIDKAKTQANNLIKGVLALSKEDKNAQNVIDDLKKAGINFQDAPAQTKGSAAPAK